MRRKEKNRLLTIVIVLALAGLSMLGKKLGWIDEDSGEFSPPTSNRSSSPGSKDSLGDYEILRGCVLAKDRNNDGDSFLVRHGNEEHIMRLYFVDCPEKRLHQYNGKRISEQAQYFRISDDDAIEVGIAAKEFTTRLLSQGSFDIATKWEPVYSNERFYGFVMLPPAEGGKNSTPRYLCELLISEGLGRIHTKGSDLPTGTKWRTFKDHLKEVESTAKSRKLGAWGK